MIAVPEVDKLDAIKAQGRSDIILSKEVGPFRLSCVYRRSSAVLDWPLWYPEAAIFREGRMVWMGEGWGPYLSLANDLNTSEQVEAFLASEEE